MKFGPNVKKLVIRKMSRDMIPDGGGFVEGLNALQGDLAGASREATKWVAHAIDIVKRTSDNPFGDDDEAIAEEILRRMEQA